MPWAFKGSTGNALAAISQLVARLSGAVDSWLLGMLLDPELVLTRNSKDSGALPLPTLSPLSIPSGSNGDGKREECSSYPPF